MSAHTPEPWHLEERGTIECGQKLNSGFIVADIGGCGPDFPANGKRIIQCVNALTNIPDPAEALRMAKEALEDMQRQFSSLLWTSDDGKTKRPGDADSIEADGYKTIAAAFRKATAALAALKGEQ